MRRDSIDLNCVMGESFGAYKIGLDEAIIEHITVARGRGRGYHQRQRRWRRRPPAASDRRWSVEDS